MKKTTKRVLSDYQRVTSILQPFTDFSNIDPKVLANACDRGTRVHRFCELYIKNLLIEPVDEDCKPYFESFVKWFNKAVDKVRYVEERLFCDRMMLTGQIDLVCSLKGSENLHIIDFKTPQQVQKTWQLQTSAYQYLFEKNYSQTVLHRGCLMLSKSGDIAKMKTYENHHKDLSLFMSAYNLNKFFKG